MRKHLLGGACVVAAFAATLVALSPSANAQGSATGAYPNRFIKIIVPYSAGGGTDVVARVIGEKLGERLGQPVVIENKPGAGARLGTEFVATQPADGYTLLIAGGSEMAISPLIAKTNYDALKSFIPLTIAIEMPLILLVPPNHPAQSPKDLIAWAKSNPGKSNYATTAPGFTLPAELFKLRTGTPAVAITFKSANEGSVALMSGEASMAFFTPPGIVNQVKAGNIRALAVTTSTRSPDLPDVPTLQEAGIDINITNWNGFFVPAGTPQPIVDKLTTELRHVVLNTDVKAKLRDMFTNPVGLSPQDSTKRIESDTALWRDVIAKAELKFGNQ
jgi:tripartite-type tricarboxylate transporter receptor subunit TctC